MGKIWDFSELIDTATAVCRKAGYPVKDIEYESAINSAVGEIIVTYGDDRPSTLYCSAALHECLKVKLMFTSWAKQDAAGAGRGACSAPVATPIRLSAFEVLSFFAKHGRTRGARMLRMTVPKVNELLHDVAREIDAARC